MSTAQQAPRRPSRFLVFCGLGLAGLILLALAYDMGRISLVRTQLQMAADNTALAAATRLDRPQEEVLGQADRFAGHFRSASGALRQSDFQVELGNWDAASRRFSADDSHDAVRVTFRRGGADARGEVQLFFGRIFGLSSVPVAASAVATADDGRAVRGPKEVAAAGATAPVQVRLVQ